MKYLNYFLGASLALAMMACGGKSETTETETTENATEATSEYSAPSTSDDVTVIDEETSSESVEESTAENNEANDVLDEYEKFVDKYVAAAKKAKNGDISAIADLATLSSDATSLYDKLSKMTLTPDQAAKLAKIQTKFLEAAK